MNMHVKSHPSSLDDFAYLCVYDDDGNEIGRSYYTPSWHQWGPLWFVEWRMRRLARRAIRAAQFRAWAYRG